MNFIKKIFLGKNDESLHPKFVRYGKGEFERLFFTLKKGKTLKVKTSWDFSNELFKIIAERAEENMKVSGKIIANRDIEKEIPCEADIKKRGKLYTATINSELSPAQMKEICERFGNNFILLSVKGKNMKLSAGKNLPKPGGKIKPDFCKAELPLDALEEFAFDFDNDFKEAEIVHIIKITDIIIPEELKNDPAKARVEAKRKGVLIRKIKIDGKEIIHEKEFEI